MGVSSGTPRRVQGVLTGCTPDAQGVFPCASGEHPLYTPCTRRLGVSGHALVGVGMPGIDVYRSFRPVVCCEGWNVPPASRTRGMCLKSGQPDAVMGVGLLVAEGSLARRCGKKLRCALFLRVQIISLASVGGLVIMPQCRCQAVPLTVERADYWAYIGALGPCVIVPT